jgi:hypothetical protein
LNKTAALKNDADKSASLLSSRTERFVEFCQGSVVGEAARAGNLQDLVEDVYTKEVVCYEKYY